MQLVEQIKDNLDILTALQKYTTADLSKLRGKKGNILCPFHHEKTGSFLVDTINNTWHCFGSCATGGDVITLYAFSNGISNKDSIKLLASDLGLKQENKKLSKKVKIDFIKKKTEKEALNFIELDIDRTYNELCSIRNIMKNLIDKTDNIEELEEISNIIDDELYASYLLDCLLNCYSREDYLKSYVEAKEMVKVWQLVLKTEI
ncbi:zinc finger CHC2-family protein [Clostridium carboxidivorans P7]|uniref:Zinc finger CHC2-family protein n=1 Tax=Clostridium carboxidivorans P7 TaxID=536227 RepID=C6PSF9_9CLOT|nr:CHC2 zinc finger domain-containing protein [Clostridium carboxidivorans]AKN32583.1 zinc finger CHC2-family protein [Clostridium carboxidivorans P7]EET87837.1 zinc finger CHC2-family protein [Clostridium carboxidivorans P7]EFG90209.1 CHC2 zinc finger domain-containing protein [Clostridium carboxidivorans P7]